MNLDKYTKNVIFIRCTPAGWEIVDMKTDDVIASGDNLDDIMQRIQEAGYDVFLTAVRQLPTDNN